MSITPVSGASVAHNLRAAAPQGQESREGRGVPDLDHDGDEAAGRAPAAVPSVNVASGRLDVKA